MGVDQRTMRTAEILALMKSSRFDPGFDLNDVLTQPGPEPNVESLHLSDYGFMSSRAAQQLFALRLPVLQQLEDCGGQGWQGRRIGQG